MFSGSSRGSWGVAWLRDGSGEGFVRVELEVVFRNYGRFGGFGLRFD